MFNINNKNIITNFYTKYDSDNSDVFIQVYGQPHVEINKILDNEIDVILHDTCLNFSENIKYINDGLLDFISFKQKDNDVIFKIVKYFDSSHQFDEIRDIPYIFHISFDRQIIKNILNNKKISVKYSQNDSISKTGLVEKDIMKKISSIIINNLTKAGCTITDNSADICLFLAESDENEDYSGYSIKYYSDDVIDFVNLLNKNFKAKLPLDDHGIKKINEDIGNKIIIETANINSRLDDAHLRSKDYREKINESILVSLIEYYK